MAEPCVDAEDVLDDGVGDGVDGRVGCFGGDAEGEGEVKEVASGDHNHFEAEDGDEGRGRAGAEAHEGIVWGCTDDEFGLESEVRSR